MSFKIKLPHESDVDYAKRLVASIALRDGEGRTGPKLTPVQIADLQQALNQFRGKYNMTATTASRMTQEEFDQRTVARHGQNVIRTQSKPLYQHPRPGSRRGQKPDRLPCVI